MDELQTPEMISFVEKQTKATREFFKGISKGVTVGGKLAQVQDITQATKFAIKKGIVPDLVQKPAFVKLFKNVQLERDMFADDSHKEYLDGEEWVRLMSVVGILAFKMDPDLTKRLPTSVDKAGFLLQLVQK